MGDNWTCLNCSPSQKVIKLASKLFVSHERINPCVVVTADGEGIGKLIHLSCYNVQCCR